MAIHDYNLANAAGIVFRADINDVLSAIVSQNSSLTEPTTLFAYMFWADTTTATLKQRNSINTAWNSLFNLSTGQWLGSSANVTVVDAAADTTTWPMLARSQTGDQAPTTDAGLTYDAATNILGANISGSAVSITNTGGQIPFPATQNPSADVHVLDDYEEGTWVPSVGGTATYSSQVGYYTKIGNVISIHGTIQINAIGTGSTVNITGLPFALKAGVNIACPVHINTAATAIVSAIGRIISNDTSISIWSRTAASANPATVAIFQNSTLCEFSSTYLTN